MTTPKASPADDKQQFTLTRDEIIKQVQREVGSYTLAKQLVSNYFKLIEQSLLEGKPVKLHNFGRFTLLHKRERTGRNPRSGETKLISARSVVSFRPSNKMRDAVRNSYRSDSDGQGNT